MSHSTLETWRPKSGQPEPTRLSPAVGDTRRNGPVRQYFRALRPHQWSKNLLVFASLPLAMRSVQLWDFVECCLAFVAFCLAASAGYIVNDLVDRRRDQLCETRRKRPFAAGEISTLQGLMLFALLVAAAGSVAACWLPNMFAVLLVIYLSSSISYSLFGKHWKFADILWLASFYVIRIGAGAAASGNDLPYWALVGAFFYFANLSLVKRYGELRSRSTAENEEASVVPPRSLSRTALTTRLYRLGDVDTLRRLGMAGAALAMLISAVGILYRAPTSDGGKNWMLLTATALLAMWTQYIWNRAQAGKLGVDPTWFVIRDKTSVLTGVVLIVLVVWAT